MRKPALQGVGLCLRLLRGEKRSISFLLAIAASSALLTGVGDPVAMKLLIDSLGDGNIGRFAGIVLLLLLVYTLERLTRYASSIYAQRLKNRICRRTTDDLFNSFFRLPYEKVNARDRAYFVSRIYDEPSQVTTVVDLSVRSARSVVMFAGAVGVCIWLSWQITLALSLVVPVLLYLSDRFGGQIRRTTIQEKEAEAALRESVGRSVESYKNVIIFGLLPSVRRSIDKLLDRSLDSTYERVRLSSGFQAGSGLLLSYAEMAVLVGAAVQTLRGHLTIGGLFGFITAYWRAVNALRGLTGELPSWARLAGEVDRIEAFRRSDSAPRSEVPASAPAGAMVDLANAGLDLGGRKVLNAVNLQIDPGERVLVRGPNGCGKTTLVHLIAGFYGVHRGRATAPDRSRISALLLPFGFIPGSLRDNLFLEAHEPRRRQLAYRLLGQFGLTDKLDTDPCTFSEGEKRKSQILMVLLKQADLYLFDEPLSHVDADSKRTIMDVIAQQTRGKSVIVIMHGEEGFRASFDREIHFRVDPTTTLGPAPVYAESESADV